MRKYKVSEPQESGVFFRMLLEGMNDKETINIGLPGGRSIVPILREMSNIGANLLSRCRFYLVDERAEGEKNEQTLRENFFDEAIAEGKLKEEQLIFPVFSGDVDKDIEEYKSKVPERFDLIVFGVGEDGHVAAMYPGSEHLDSVEPVVYMDDSPKPPPKRFSMTFNAFNKDAVVILLFFGDAKREAFKRFMDEDYKECPAAYFDDYEGLHIITDID
ncbi:MAG: 6-phosphogluconolactonase [Candidatus Woesearchaeota archaeon]